MPEIQQKKGVEKEPVEIQCSDCSTTFRLWIPAEKLGEWERGSRINCVKCGAQFLIRWTGSTFHVNPISEFLKREAERTVPAAHVEQASAPAPAPAPVAPAVHHAPVQPPVEPARPQPVSGPAPGAETILVVEDDRLSRDMVENTLSGLGFFIVPVKSSTEALRAAKGKVHLIVTDLYLKNPVDPESLLDGEELLARLREMGVAAPAIITTGKDIIDDLVLDPKWFELNVKGFIQKGNPFWAEELKLKVKEVLYKG